MSDRDKHSSLFQQGIMAPKCVIVLAPGDCTIEL